MRARSDHLVVQRRKMTGPLTRVVNRGKLMLYLIWSLVINPLSRLQGEVINPIIASCPPEAPSRGIPGFRARPDV